MSFKDSLSTQIRTFRLSLKLTQEQFASQLGVTFATVNRWERGKTIPSPLARQHLQKMQNDLQSGTQNSPASKKAVKSTYQEVDIK